MKKRIISIVTALILVVTMIPSIAFASGASEQTERPEEVLSYFLDAGEITINGCEWDTSGRVVIPEKIDGYPVTRIGNSAFDFNSKITEVVLPETIKSIGEQAFMQCIALEKVNFPYGLTTIGVGAFANCENLAAAKLSDSVKVIGERAFKGCTNLQSIYVPEGIPRIGEETFSECRSLKEIYIPDSVQCVESSAFYACSSLTTAIIGAETIQSKAFSLCENLKTITFTENVKTLESRAFVSCKNVEKVVFAEGLETLGEECIESDMLDAVDLPYSLQSMQKDSFAYTTNLGCYRDSYAESCAALYDLSYYIRGGSEAENTLTGSVGDNLSWKLDKRSGILTVTCDGNMPDFVYEEAPWSKHYKQIKGLVLDGNCLSIGDYAFAELSLIEDVSLTDTVTSIGVSAFSGCETLTDLSIPEAVTDIEEDAFKRCTKLEYVKLPDGVINIGATAFDNCRSLKFIDIPESVKYIGDEAFNACKNLTTVTLNEGLEAVGRRVFLHCESLKDIYIPSSLKVIGEGMFQSCSDLTTVELSEGIECISQDAFDGCKSLANITLPESVTQIGLGAFAFCGKIEDINLHDGIEEIGAQAFWNCKGLTSVVIPKKIKTLSEGVFSDCTNLTTVVIPDTVTEFEDDVFRGCMKLTIVNLPDSLTKIGSMAFSDCDGLTEIIVPDGVTEIESGAFGMCSNLKQVLLPDSLEKLGEDAFSYCEMLEAVSVPEKVTSIGDGLFQGCVSLKHVDLHNSINEIGSAAFEETSILEMEIPDSVKKIDRWAFNNCDELVCIKIGDGVETIEGEAFKDCANLTEVYFGKGVKTIEQWAFFNCSAVETIVFKGCVENIEMNAFRSQQYIYADVYYYENIGWEEKFEDLNNEYPRFTWIPVEHTHKFDAGNITLDATCVSEGETTFTCKECNFRRIEPIPKKDHVSVEIAAKQPTCLEAGHTAGYACSFCEKRISGIQTLPAAGHSYGEWEITRIPDCIKEGIKTKTCAACGDKIREELPKIEHVPYLAPAEEPTCATEGKTERYECTICGRILSENWQVARLPHEYGEWITDTEATCYENGSKHRACVCGETETEIIFAQGHNMVEEKQLSKPTCTEAGEAQMRCSSCGEIKITTLPPTGHERTVIPAVPPTCTEDGHTTSVVCSICKEVFRASEVVAARGHLTVALTSVEPTCMEDGKTAGEECTRCGEITKPQEVIPASREHCYGEWQVTKAATTKAGGEETQFCVFCGEANIIFVSRIKSVTLKANKFAYTGKAIRPVITVKNGNLDKLVKGTDYTVKYVNNKGKAVTPKNVGTYKAVITFKGKYSGSVTRQFTINPKSTAIIKLTKPGKKQFKVTWTKRTVQVTGYEIQYSTTKNFTKKTTKTMKVKNFKINTKTIKKLKAKKKYWVKVRTYKNVNGKLYYSKWSPVKTVKTK